MSDITEAVLADIRQERERQPELGYTTEHDDTNGYKHTLGEAQTRTHQALFRAHTEHGAIGARRQEMVIAAALLVASIETIDRMLAKQELDDPEQSVNGFQ